MTLAEKLVAARAELVSRMDKLTAASDAGDVILMDELSQMVETQTEEVGAFERAEKALAKGAKPVAVGGDPPPRGTTAPEQQPTKGAPALAMRGHIRQRKASGFDLIVRSAVAAFESYHTHDQVESVIQRRWPDNLEVIETSKLMAYGLVGKAAQNPAFTSVEGWAAELVREGYTAFMEALAPESIVPRIPMTTYQFDQYGKINIPSRAAPYPDNPNLSAAFRAEGAPIRVGATQTVSKYLTPKSMGVIGTFSKELLRRSTPNIEEAIRQWMLEDTALALDVTFLDDVAGTVIRPAGIRYGIPPEDQRASSGNTPQDITNDVMAMLTGLSAHHMGRRPVWVMNQARAWGLTFSRTPTGDPAFPGMTDYSGTGSLAGIPVIASTTVPPDVILLLDAAEVGFAGGAPTFEGTDVATLHEDSGDPNANMVTGASVLPLVAAGGAVAAPARSLFQTHSAALKATWEIDWTVVRPGAVQVLTGVAWGTPTTP